MPKLTTKTCPSCKTQVELEVTSEEFVRWEEGAYIQDAFPTMPLGDRERLISGYCGPCWNKLFAEGDDGLDEIEDDVPEDFPYA